jgi:hypothetical protein
MEKFKLPLVKQPIKIKVYSSNGILHSSKHCLDLYLHTIAYTNLKNIIWNHLQKFRDMSVYNVLNTGKMEKKSENEQCIMHTNTLVW